MTTSSLPEPVTAQFAQAPMAPAAPPAPPAQPAGEWAPPAEGWAGVPANAGEPAPAAAGRWTGKKVIAAVALTAALAGGAGFGIGMAVDSGSATQQGGPGGGQFPGGGGPGGMNGGGLGNQQDGTTQQQDGTTQQQDGVQPGTVQNGPTSTT